MGEYAWLPRPAVAIILQAERIVIMDNFFKEHEPLSKDRDNDMQEHLKQYVALGDEAGMRRLNLQLDAQLKLEDFLIKFREANHAWIWVWSPVCHRSLESVGI
jgi:hypothetical protein